MLNFPNNVISTKYMDFKVISAHLFVWLLIIYE